MTIYESARQGNDFGNGRFARNLFEKAKLNQAARLISLDADAVTKADIATLLPEDFEAPFITNKQKKRIGF